MLKAKVFYAKHTAIMDDDGGILEGKINEWLNGQKLPCFKHVTQSENTGGVTYIIIYDTKGQGGDE